MLKNIKKILIKVFLFLIIIGFACGLIYIGLYLNKVSKKSYPFEVTVDMVFAKAEQILLEDDKYILKDNFYISGSVDSELSSEEYASKSKVDIEYLKKNNKLKSLSLMDTKFEISQDRNDGRWYASLDEKIGTNSVFSGKYLINDSTRYFLVNGILKNYVNDGGSTYFESFNDKNSSISNLNYVYYFIRDSLKKHIKEEELEGFDTETNINNESMKVSQISYKITDKTIKNLLSGVLNDLKKDDKCKNIIGGIFSDFSNWKIDKNKKYLNSNESYILNIYTKKLINTPLKYEIVYMVDDQKEIYSYEGDENNGVFYYSLNNEVKYNAVYKNNNKKVDITVTDRKDNSVGTIKIDKDVNNLIFTLTLDLDKDKYDINYSRKFANYNKDNYDREDNLSFRIMKDMINKINGNIKVTSKVESKAKIDEDISDSVLRSTISASENEKIDNLRENISNVLEK